MSSFFHVGTRCNHFRGEKRSESGFSRRGKNILNKAPSQDVCKRNIMRRLVLVLTRCRWKGAHHDDDQNRVRAVCALGVWSTGKGPRGCCVRIELYRGRRASTDCHRVAINTAYPSTPPTVLPPPAPLPPPPKTTCVSGSGPAADEQVEDARPSLVDLVR
jgi:hypothetical protein